MNISSVTTVIDSVLYVICFIFSAKVDTDFLEDTCSANRIKVSHAGVASEPVRLSQET